MMFLLYGPDTYRSTKQLEKFIAEFKIRRDPFGYNTSLLEGTDLTVDSILEHCLTAPFLGEKRLVVIKDIFKNKDGAFLDGLHEALKKDILEKNTVMVFWEAGEPPKKIHPLFEELIKEKYTQNFITSEKQLVEWICSTSLAEGVQMDHNTASALIETIGTDKNTLELTIHKLGAWARGGGVTQLTIHDIHTLTSSPFDDEVFHFIDALFGKRTEEALHLLHNQWRAGANAQEVFGALAWHIRTLLEIKDYMTRGAPYLRSADISRELGVHPFVVKKTAALVSRVSMETLVDIHTQLLVFDRDIKTGVRTTPLAFDQLVIFVSQVV